MRKLLLPLFFTFATSYISFSQQRGVEGTFIIYTKSQQCEIVKTYAVFSIDHYFQIFSTCNGVFYKRFSSNNVQQGKWTYLNDSTVEVSVPKRPIMKFKILSDSLIELQKESKFKPQYKRE